jgi:hypothetical protein
LKWKVPSFGVDRPKSNVLSPCSTQHFNMCQYRNTLALSALADRNADAHGTSAAPWCHSTIDAATGRP